MGVKILDIKISALMTVHNGEKYISESIESILDQTFEHYELIIVDDASTDNTLNIIKKYNDSRIKIIELKRNVGVGAAIVEGLKYTTCQYIAKVDADDIYHKERFSKQLLFLESNPSISLIDSKIEYFADDFEVLNSNRFLVLKEREIEINKITSTADIEKYLYWYVCLTHSSIMFRKEILNYASYRELRIGEDYDLFYRWNKLGIQMYKMNDILAKIRVTSNSTTANKMDYFFNNILCDMKYEEIKKIYLKHSDVFIWGTGKLAENVYNYLEGKRLSVQGFIERDSSKYGKQFINKKIYSFDEVNKQGIGILVAASIAKFPISRILDENNLLDLDDYLILF